MTVEEVQSLVTAQSQGDFPLNQHRKDLKQCLISPQQIRLIIRDVVDGRVKDRIVSAWLVGQETKGGDDGYSVIMREDGKQFGLASKGFPNDKHLTLTGWYGSLPSAFFNM